MNFLSVENLSKHYGERVLFENLNFGLNKGDKVALIANNGAGKTSLLKILTGQDIADAGKVTFRKGIEVGFLAQNPDFDDNQTIQELINTSSSRMLEIVREYEEALEAQSNNYNPATHKAFEIASAKMDEHEVWDYERKTKTILTKFNIHDVDKKIETLSGGERKRLALALVLLDNPDLIILDEPTNHLDVEMIEWLEEYLIQSAVTLLMVTHDRYFLETVCNHILELTDGKLYHHEGNYSFFLEKRAEREENYNTELGKAQKLMKSELEWMRRMPKARTTKSKARIDAFYEIKEKATNKKVKQELKLEVKMSRIGGKILELKKVYKSYGGQTLLKGFDYTFRKGERIGIIGKNGVGKSTFLNIITGSDTADTGKVNTGETIVYGYYSQGGITLKEDKRVIEVVKDIADYIVMGNGTKLMASQFLQHFMFPPEMQYTFVSKLSGGEKRRLYLLTVLMKNPNFLIMDEPTNDLDLLTLNKLEEFILSYEGCVIIVSHDRYFMDKLVDHLFIFEGNGVIRDYNGTYSTYRIAEIEKEKQLLKQNKVNAANAELKEVKPQALEESPKEKKLSFKEKLEYEKLEKEIAALENEKANLEKSIHASETPYQELVDKSQRIGEVIKLLDEKTMRWMDLSV